MKVSKWVSASIRFPSTIKKIKFNLFLTVFVFIVPKFKLKKISKKNNFFFFFWYQQQRKIKKKKKIGMVTFLSKNLFGIQNTGKKK